MVGTFIVVAYFVSWSIYARSYFVSDIPGDIITHINYAFANIGFDGCIAPGDPWADIDKAFPGDTWDQPIRGNFNQLLKLKQNYPHIRTLISIGGWTWSTKFSSVALTPTSRTKFANSCIEFIDTYGFDGIDLDWEYPGNTGVQEDTQNYVLLLQEIRRLLNILSEVNGRTYLLTVATSAGPANIANLDLLGMETYLDWFNVMTYDFHGSWETQTGHNAPLFENSDEMVEDVAPDFIKSRYNCDAAIQTYLQAGVLPSKLIMGMPLYGRGWLGVTSTVMNGFSQLSSSQFPMGTWESSIYDFDDLKENYLSIYTRYWDNASKVPFLYSRSTTIWISYDDEESIGFKNNYIKQYGLAGAMFWELTNDREGELIEAISAGLNNVTRQSSSSPSSSIYFTTPGTVTTEILKPTETTIVSQSDVTTPLPNSNTPCGPSGDCIPAWQPLYVYHTSDLVKYAGKTYRCIQGHTSLPGWTPPLTPSLWQAI